MEDRGSVGFRPTRVYGKLGVPMEFHGYGRAPAPMAEASVRLGLGHWSADWAIPSWDWAIGMAEPMAGLGPGYWRICTYKDVFM